MNASYVEYRGAHAELERLGETSTLPCLADAAFVAVKSLPLGAVLTPHGSQLQRLSASGPRHKTFKYYTLFCGLVDEPSPLDIWTLADTGLPCRAGMANLERFPYLTKGMDFNLVMQDITDGGEPHATARGALECIYLSKDDLNSSWTTAPELVPDFVRVHNLSLRRASNPRLGHKVSKGMSSPDAQRTTRNLVSHLGPNHKAAVDPKQKRRVEALSLLASWLVEGRDPALDNEGLSTLMHELDEDRKGGRKLFESQ